MNSKKTAVLLILIGSSLLSLILLLLVSPARAEMPAQTAPQGEAIFQQKCQACHTIGGGRLVGPDLLGVTQRRDRTWLAGFISAPDQVLATNDPIAAQLLADYGGLPMPNLGLSETEVAALITYLESVAANPQQPAAPPAAQVAAPAGGDPNAGRRLFTGAAPLTNRAPACIACHHVQDLAFPGGGSLGPDLTHVFTRYGAAGLGTTLTTLPFPTMQGIFTLKPLTPAEQADLYAFFAEVDQLPAVPAAPTSMLFLGLGGLGALSLFGVMLFSWPRQRRSLAERLRSQK